MYGSVWISSGKNDLTMLVESNIYYPKQNKTSWKGYLLKSCNYDSLTISLFVTGKKWS